ncbi:hypothetical protein CJ030_MR1G017662, partial [Morella rubra]
RLLIKFMRLGNILFKEFEDKSWEDKCACLLLDPIEMWNFNDPSTSNYISALEEELETVRKSMDNLQSKLRMGLEIENHLKGKVRELEKNKSNIPGLPYAVAYGKCDASETVAQALQEKQEERHLLERNVNAALQRKVEELQRNLLQVTNEKVKALMDFAQLKQEYQLLQENGKESKGGKALAGLGGMKLFTQEQDMKLKNLLKRTYLRRWIGRLDGVGDDTEVYGNSEGKFFSRRSNSMDLARMKIEHATLKESMECMEHLTSSVHRLRLSLLKAKESISEGTETSISEGLDDIINEAKLVKTALGSSLPISWSAEADVGSIDEIIGNDPKDLYGDSSSEKLDAVSAAGFEMVELLIVAAQILRDKTMKSGT